MKMWQTTNKSTWNACFYFILAKNVLSCIQAKLDSIKAKLTSEKHLGGVAESIDKFSTRKSIDERNNNSDYEEPCKRPKIDLGSSSPIHLVRSFFIHRINSSFETVKLLISHEMIAQINGDLFFMSLQYKWPIFFVCLFVSFYVSLLIDFKMIVKMQAFRMSQVQLL